MLVLHATISDRVTKAVGAVITTLVDAFDVSGVDTFEIGLFNLDAAQLLNAQLEKSDSASGPWNVFDDGSFAGMDPLGNRANVIRMLTAKGRTFIRVRGTASGAGFNALVLVQTYFERRSA